MIDRRTVLLALGALAAGGAQAAPAGVDPQAAQAIGAAYLARRPGFDARKAQAELLPDGWSPAALRRLRARAARDFRDGRLFVHRGWRLSETEGMLFAILTV